MRAHAFSRQVLERVRTAEKLPGVSEIIIPGQREALLAEKRVREGTVPLEKNMLAELRVLASNWAAMQQQGIGGAAAGGGGGEARTNQLLEQLLSRMDGLETQLRSTQEATQQVGSP